MIYDGTTIINKQRHDVVFNTDDVSAMVKHTEMVAGDLATETGTIILYLRGGAILNIEFNIDLYRSINNCMIKRNINEIKALENSTRTRNRPMYHKNSRDRFLNEDDQGYDYNKNERYYPD